MPDNTVSSLPFPSDKRWDRARVTDCTTPQILEVLRIYKSSSLTHPQVLRLPKSYKFSTYMTLQKLHFSPAVPLPPVWDNAACKRRMIGLKAHLDPNSETYFPWVDQHVNIKAIIEAYETGTIDGTKRVNVRKNNAAIQTSACLTRIIRVLFIFVFFFREKWIRTSFFRERIVLK